MKKRRLAAGLLVTACMMGSVQAEPGQTEYATDLAPEEVYALEERLNALGYLAGGYDEVYDEDTRLAIEGFQQANGLTVNGEADAETVARINDGTVLSKEDYLRQFVQTYEEMEPLKNGDINERVSTMQKKLKEYGYFSYESDGVFGEATQLAVERFQMVNGLTATGVADGATMMRLMAETPVSWQAFLSEMRAEAGNTGLNVYTLQKKLKQMGYFAGDCTGNFGDITQKAVLQFQAANNLEQTGVADEAMWEVIYSGNAVAPRKENVLQMGDFGASVQQIQQRLSELGYFSHSITGEFGPTTETAVRLFQMANDLDATGEVDADTLTRINGDGARKLMETDIQQKFREILSNQDGSAMSKVVEIANGMLGTAFEAEDDALYPGFAFVQYVCVAAGLPITHPEVLIPLADQPVTSIDEVEAGNIVAFQNASGDTVTILLTICGGDGQVIYAASAGGWVVLSYMDQMNNANVYRWSMEAASEE